MSDFEQSLNIIKETVNNVAASNDKHTEQLNSIMFSLERLSKVVDLMVNAPSKPKKIPDKKDTKDAKDTKDTKDAKESDEPAELNDDVKTVPIKKPRAARSRTINLAEQKQDVASNIDNSVEHKSDKTDKTDKTDKIDKQKKKPVLTSSSSLSSSSSSDSVDSKSNKPIVIHTAFKNMYAENPNMPVDKGLFTEAEIESILSSSSDEINKKADGEQRNKFKAAILYKHLPADKKEVFKRLLESNQEPSTNSKPITEPKLKRAPVKKTPVKPIAEDEESADLSE